MAERQADVVQALHEAPAGVVVDLERLSQVLGETATGDIDLARVEVNGDLGGRLGFGVFEKSDRPARVARNPATGAEIQVAAQSVPKFRPGADFKALVNGAGAAAAKKPAARAVKKK